VSGSSGSVVCGAQSFGAMLWKGMYWDICFATPAVKAPICSWMYSRKVLEDQRPCFLMVMVSMPLSFMAIAPPARKEWLLTLVLEKPYR
jgi:hypothetical protein